MEKLPLFDPFLKKSGCQFVTSQTQDTESLWSTCRLKLLKLDAKSAGKGDGITGDWISCSVTDFLRIG